MTYQPQPKKVVMMSFIVITFILLFTWPTYAEQPITADKPLTKEEIELHETFEEFKTQLDILQKMSEALTREKFNDCMKAFGHEKFCTCITEKSPIGLSFQDYITITIKTKEELDYISMSKEDKQLVDLGLQVRERCVVEVQTK